MRKFLVTIILALMLFICILPVISADNTPNTDTKLFYIIDGNHLISVSPDIVVSSQNLIIFHNYLLLTMDYTYENGTTIQRQRVTNSVIQIKVYDNAHLTLTDTQNNVILDTHLHTMSLENFFRYVVPISYSQLIIPIFLAFLSSLILVVAFFINKEIKIL